MTTLTGSIASLFLMFFKTRLVKTFGGICYYYICIITLLLFILPLKINLPQLATQPLVVNENVTLNQEYTNNTSNTVPSNQKALPISKESIINIGININIENTILSIWFVGFVLMFFRYLFGYFKFKNKVIQSSPIDRVESLDIVLSNYINSPMLIGFLKPIIAIPNIKINKEDYKLALLHELTHHKQKDAWIKLFAAFINSMHWFNPISYFYVNNIAEACEYSCDEKVIKNMKIREKQYYGEMILNFICLSSPELSNNLSKNKNQLYRRIELIMKTNRKSKKVLGILLTSAVISTSVMATSFVFANELKPLSEYTGAITTYYNPSKSLANNVQDTLKINSNQGVYLVPGITYIDISGRKIDTFNRTKPYYGVEWEWVESNSINEKMISKTMLIEGKELNIAFLDDARSYKDDKVIKKMIENQITYELSHKDKNFDYDHGAFINELINRGLYVVKNVITPDNFKGHEGPNNHGDFITYKLLTEFDKKSKIVSVFNQKVQIPKNINGKQGKQIGHTFIIKEGETLAIDIKETTDKMPKINVGIVNENTSEMVDWLPNAMGGYRYTFKPRRNHVNNTFKVLVSGSESDTAFIDIFTY